MSLPTTASVQLNGSAHHRAIRIFASTIARELKLRGYDPRHVVALASELISLACESIRLHHTPTPGMDDIDKSTQRPPRLRSSR